MCCTPPRRRVSLISPISFHFRKRLWDRLNVIYVQTWLVSEDCSHCQCSWIVRFKLQWFGWASNNRTKEKWRDLEFETPELNFVYFAHFCVPDVTFEYKLISFSVNNSSELQLWGQAPSQIAPVLHYPGVLQESGLGPTTNNHLHNKSVFSYLRTLTTWHCPHSPATRRRWSISLASRAHSSKSAKASLLLWARVRAGTDTHERTDGQTNGHCKT